MNELNTWTMPSPLAANGQYRGDPDWVAERWKQRRARVLRLAPGPSLDATPLSYGPASGEYDPETCWYLGDGTAGPLFAQLAEAGSTPVRLVLDEVPQAEVQALFMASALVNWHPRAARCSACSGPTHSVNGGWARVCANCGLEHFPRTDPAVIVAVRFEDRLLLGRQPVWAPRRYSVFAGFVEAGESMEQAVSREVLEEVGVEVNDIRYFGSQPWPFPRSLMVGFTAAAQTPEFAVDGQEIESAAWFTRKELLSAVAAGEVVLPTVHSIAHRLISDWLEGDDVIERPSSRLREVDGHLLLPTADKALHDDQLRELRLEGQR